MTVASRRATNRAPRPQPPRAPTQPPARRELVHRGDNAYANSMADAVNQFADPFLNAPPPEQGTAGVVANYLNGAMGLVGAPAQLIDTAIAQGIGALSNVPVLGAIIKAWPSMPAATLLNTTHLAPPHAHLHPPSFIPPATPIPLPSFGPVMLSGCVSVLVEGVPAARCGDVGLAITCGSLAPPFEIMTGSSTVFIGGARAARLTDLTRHCNPAGALGAFAKLMAVAGAVAGAANAMAMSNESDALAARGRAAVTESQEADSEAEAAAAAGEAQNLAAESAGKSMAATMAAAQAAADAGALAMSVICGKDLGVGLCVGALVGAPGTVSIGGIPMPNLGQMIMGKAFEKLKALGKKLRRRGAAPDANGTHCNVGHPVDVITGAVFDRYLDAVTAGGFRWERHYTTARSREMDVLGWGMRHSLQHELHVRLHRCVYVDWRGRRVEFPRFRPGEDRVTRFGYALQRLPDHRYRVTFRDDPALIFKAAPFVTEATLVSVTTRETSLSLTYDPAGHLTGWTEHRDGDAPRAHRVSYDDAWRVVAVEGISRDGRAWRCGYAYDRGGCLATARDVDGHDEHYAYDDAHRLTAWTDRRGYSYRWRYDDEGRCVWTSGEDGQWHTELAYAPSKSETRVGSTPDAVWTYQYDPADGVLLRIEDPCGGEYLRARDGDGRVVREVDWAGRAWAMRYDADGAHVGRVDPFGRALPTQVELPVAPPPALRALPETAQAYVYGGAARVDPKLAWQGVATDWWWQIPEVAREAALRAVAWASELQVARAEVVRDDLGRVVRERDARGRTRAWSYDATGNVVARQDRAGRVWRRETSRWNLLGAETDPLGHRVTYAHTDDEKVRRVVDAGGTASEYDYDAKGRLTAVRRHGATRDAYAYDLRDRLVEKRDGAGRALLRVTPHDNGMPAVIEPAVGATITLDYDARGLATRADAGPYAVEIVRDRLRRRLCDLRDGVGVLHRWSADDVERTTVLGRFAVRYVRDGVGGVRVHGPSGRVERVRGDGSGAVLRECFGGAREFLHYDDDGRLAGRVAWRQGEREVSCARYLRNGEGELVGVEDSARGATVYSLDDAGRLVGVEHPDRTRETYAYDPAGNLVAKPGVSCITVGDGNRLRHVDDESFVYDDRHQLAVRERPDGVTHYRHDSYGQLIEAYDASRDGEIRGWTAAYDGLGRRVAKTVDGARTEYWWDGERVAAERTPDGRVRVYVYAGPEAMSPLGFVDYEHDEADPASGRAYSVFHDPLGMPSRVEDERGRTVWRALRAEAYGALTVDPRSTVRYDARWPGHWHDAELGLHYNRFRYYDPRLGRYLESDPLGLRGGLNVYAYCANPAHAVDLVGLHPDDDQHSKTQHPEGEGHAHQEGTPHEGGAPHAHDDEHPRPRVLVDENIGAGRTPEEAARAMWERMREHVEGQVDPRRQATELGRELHDIGQERAALNERSRAARAEQGEAGKEIGAARRDGADAAKRGDEAGVAHAGEREQNARTRQDEARAEQERVAARRGELDAREQDVTQRRDAVPADPDHSPMAVHEAAYDPTTGRMVVVSSGAEPASPSVRVPESTLDTTNPGHCGMPRAAGVLMDDHPNGTPPAPIMTTQGGLRYDNDGNVSHVSACRNCENIVDNNPITHVGGTPPGVPDNVRPNTDTPLNPSALHDWQP